ncbi:MAG: hypothetical protein Q7J06_04420, partial [Bacteroidales bacterium]|nr:hypothetical protein [Bacteroidales bacterium]
DGRNHDKITVYDHVNKSEIMIVDQITELIMNMISANGLRESDLPGIGMGFPGHVRYKDGHTITTSNLKGFKNLFQPSKNQILRTCPGNDL